MGTPYFIAVLFLLAQCQDPSPPPNTADIDVAHDQKTLRYLKEVEWPKAYREQDTLLLDRILGEDFQMITNNGKWFDKAHEMGWIKENTTAYDSFRYDIKPLDVLPNGTAVVCGTGHVVNDTVKTVYQSSNILIKRNGIWKAVASHVSGVTTQPNKQ